MQSYQQFLSLPTYHQLPPLASGTNQCPLSAPVMAFGETRIGGFPGNCNLPTPGYVSIKPPTSLVYRLHPDNYAHGFNSSGKIIGFNQEIPYPVSNTKYHEYDFPRAVEWSIPEVLTSTTFDMVMKKREATKMGKEISADQPEMAEYFTAANDEGYKKWVERNVQEQKKQNEMQTQIRTVTSEIKALPGHFNPTITETSNETYGQYLDLRPKYPAVYPLPAKVPPMPLQVQVKFRQSNMSDHPFIPDHAFAVDPREMINTDGCYTRGIHGSVYYPQGRNSVTKTAYTFRQNEPILGQIVGERSKGYTWPLHAPTGLEINRPVSRCVSVVAGVNGKKKLRTQLPPRAVPYIYNRYMYYTNIQSNDPETEANPAILSQRKTCAPFTPHPPINPLRNPCTLKFVNPHLLPVPVELRKPPSC